MENQKKNFLNGLISFKKITYNDTKSFQDTNKHLLLQSELIKSMSAKKSIHF